MAKAGDNSKTNADAEALQLLVERIERLEEEKKGIADDIRDVYSEVKAYGYETKIVRQVVKLRKQAQEDRTEERALLDTYCAALGIEF